MALVLLEVADHRHVPAETHWGGSRALSSSLSSSLGSRALSLSLGAILKVHSATCAGHGGTRMRTPASPPHTVGALPQSTPLECLCLKAFKADGFWKQAPAPGLPGLRTCTALINRRLPRTALQLFLPTPYPPPPLHPTLKAMSTCTQTAVPTGHI